MINYSLDEFMQRYEQANNSHVWANVEPFIAPDATYWFTDGSYAGIQEIRKAIEATFASIQDEDYKISDVRWVIKTATTAVCTYVFSWQGVVDGQPKSGTGRGTNVLEKRVGGDGDDDGAWRIVHEHLSA